MEEYIKTIDYLKLQSRNHPILKSEVLQLEQKLGELKTKIYSELSPWQRVMISRHPGRPRTIDYIKEICDRFVELAGDRYYGEDRSIIGGLATIAGIRCMVLGQEKGKDTESRVYRNFGMLSPEGFRKALRLMKLAEKYGLPIISFLDTPGAYPGLEAEERGQGWAIANNLREMARIKTPIIVIIIGEGCSGGALGMGVGDVIGMLEHSYYSVISPEGCASILWKDASKNVEAASALKLNAEDLIKLGVIDVIINEPPGGAHHQPKVVFDNVKAFIADQWETLQYMPDELLVEQRYLKFRRIGRFEESARI